MQRTLNVLDVRYRIRCDDPALVASFLAVFSAFLSSDGEKEAERLREISVRIDGRAGSFVFENETVPLIAGSLRPIHIYNLLYRTLARSISNAFLLHAAAASRGGKAWVLAGPSGSGKTSLVRALTERGFDLLSDDIAPLRVRDGRVHPFPRRIGLARREGDAASGVALGDKDFVAPEALGIGVACAPLPLGAVVALNPYASWDQGPVPVTIGLVEGGAETAARLGSVPGIEIHQRPGPPGVTVIEALLDGAAAMTAFEREIEHADRDVLFHQRGYGSEKRYARQPRLEPASARDMAGELLRETLNREAQSALMQRHRGSVASALFELIGLLAAVPCYRLQAGEIAATADELSRAFSD